MKLFARPYLQLITLIGVIVPKHLRAGWRQEWEAELQHREALLSEWDRLDVRHKLQLLRQSTSAFWDALWLQPQRLEDEMFQDLRYGIRLFFKNIAFTAIAITTLALGIGANLTIFTFVDTMFFRPLPVRDPYELVNVGSGQIGNGYAYPVYSHLRDHNKSFDSLAAHYSTAPFDLTTDSGSQMISGAVVSANYFSTLGISPLMGRFFLPEEDSVPDRDRVAVIGYGCWQGRFGGDPSVLQKQIRLNGSNFTIVGVAPKDFHGVLAGYPNDVWIPTMMLRVGYRWCNALTDLNCNPLESIGRLAPNHSSTSVSAELNTLSRQFAAASGNKDRGISISPALGVRAQDRESLSYQMRLMMIMTGLLLLIACANVAALLLAQGTARRKEIAVRLSIGAGRVRLIRQFLTESFLLTFAAGVLGLLVSLWSKNLLLVYYTTNYSPLRMRYDLSLNPRTLLYALGLTLVAGILFAVVPAIQSTRHSLVRALKDEGGSQSPRHRGRNILVISQVALSLALLVSAGLLLRSASHVRKGANFDPQNVVALRLRPRLRDYPPDKAQAFTRGVVDRLQATPGVQSVSLTKGTGLAWQNSGSVRTRLPEHTYNRPEDQPRVQYHEIAPRLLDTLKIPLIQGRDFSDADRSGTPRVVIVNETLAKQTWPNESPLERSLMVNDEPYRVVGVFKDSQLRSVVEPPLPFLYIPYWQNNLGPQIDSYVVARVAGDPQTMLPSLLKEIAAVDSNVPVEGVPLTRQVESVYKPVLLTSSVLTAAAAIALFLSMIGLYGALSFAVNQRTREIGIRMALGAQTAAVLRMIVGQGLRLVLVGVMIGLLVAFAATRLMKTLLYGVSATDPLTYILIALLLMGVALIACLIPARRAAKVDPLVALRYE